jgi:hypothetical protein
MRKSVLVIALLLCGYAGTAQADPYRWCAEYAGGQNGGGTNCWFVTYEQCRAAISGNGGFCRVNTFYDGRPIVTPEETYGRARRGRF